MTWIKICGTTNLEDARAAVDAGADALGFIFAPSPRRIDPEAARNIGAELPPRFEKVGVFVNETAEHIREVAAYAGLTAVQLHGDESVAFARGLREGATLSADRARLRVFKAVAVAPGADGVLRSFAGSGAVDALLLDSAPRGADAARGGTGRSFDWGRAAVFVSGLASHPPLILAGGLSPDNVRIALQKLHPWGVDVCSGVECQPGRKDHDRLRAFVAAVRSAGEGA